MNERKKVPVYYWSIMFVFLFLWGVVGAVVFVRLGWDPYTGFSLGWWIPGLMKIVQLKKAGY